MRLRIVLCALAQAPWPSQRTKHYPQAHLELRLAAAGEWTNTPLSRGHTAWFNSRRRVAESVGPAYALVRARLPGLQKVRRTRRAAACRSARRRTSCKLSLI